ncbi:hypothetical protein EVAR_65630_1 [Eumeta japonica]|uniref:Uncharacterized protein n=1 Tax=Eumeta variegata TaxID=151549 RepID=A0A4C1Z892_EUMVA|nr:hypothetical protein EVAR_65630_1 [Eumeta japonica]
MSSQLSWPMSSSGLAPPGGTHSGGDGWRSRPPWCAAARVVAAVLGWSSVWWPRLHFAQPFARQYARGCVFYALETEFSRFTKSHFSSLFSALKASRAASLCSDAHFDTLPSLRFACSL